MSIVESTTKAIVVAGVEIVQDAMGRYSLNTLHKASGAKRAKEPSQWLENKTTQELIRRLQVDHTSTVLNVVRGGNAAGTYAHELLVVSYAGWISPRFQLHVNQAFLDAVRAFTLPVVKDPSNQLLMDAVDTVAWKKTYLYAIKQERTRRVKIGISANYRQRLATLQAANPSCLSFLGVWDVGNEARHLEKSLHTFFHSSHILGEWFSLSKTKEQRLFVLLRQYPRVLVRETEKHGIAQPMAQLALL